MGSRYSTERAHLKLIDISTPRYPNTFTQVDDSDYEELVKFRWFITKVTSRSYYVVRNLVGQTPSRIRLHQHILGVRNRVIDHVDGDALNNQRNNLRLCTVQQNSFNCKKHRRGRSQFKGVGWHKQNQKWRASIKKGELHAHLGYFDCEGCAAIAYDTAARKLFGEFARTNF